MVEPIFFIRLFNIDLYIPVLQSLGMNNLCAVIKGEKWIHHRRYLLTPVDAIYIIIVSVI